MSTTIKNSSVLPDVRIGKSLQVHLQTEGDPLPEDATMHVLSGTNLKKIELTEDGFIITPEAEGAFTFTIEIQDNMNAPITSKTFNLNVLPAKKKVSPVIWLLIAAIVLVSLCAVFGVPALQNALNNIPTTVATDVPTEVPVTDAPVIVDRTLHAASNADLQSCADNAGTHKTVKVAEGDITILAKSSDNRWFFISDSANNEGWIPRAAILWSDTSTPVNDAELAALALSDRDGTCAPATDVPAATEPAVVPPAATDVPTATTQTIDQILTAAGLQFHYSPFGDSKTVEDFGDPEQSVIYMVSDIQGNVLIGYLTPGEYIKVYAISMSGGFYEIQTSDVGILENTVNMFKTAHPNVEVVNKTGGTLDGTSIHFKIVSLAEVEGGSWNPIHATFDPAGPIKITTGETAVLDSNWFYNCQVWDASADLTHFIFKTTGQTVELSGFQGTCWRYQMTSMTTDDISQIWKNYQNSSDLWIAKNDNNPHDYLWIGDNKPADWNVNWIDLSALPAGITIK